MPTIDESITISTPAERVFGFLSDGSNLPVYDSSCVRAEPRGEPGLGTRVEGATKLLGREFGWVTECTEFEPGRSLEFKAVEGKVDFVIRYTLSLEGEDTRVDYHIEADSGLGGVFGRLADPLVTKAQSRQVKANLGVLKDLLEESAA